VSAAVHADAGPTRPLRRDAELNLERILVAAEELFADAGFEATMEAVAGRAGVGVGTLYRRFPNKESLVLAIMAKANQRSQQLVDELLHEASAAEGIFEFLRQCVGLPSSLRALVSRSPRLARAHLALVDSLEGGVTELMQRARWAGSLRADVTFGDIALVLLSVRAVETRSDARQGERHLALLLDGLRTPSGALPHQPLSRDELSAALVRE
jgi:AcrR family transcriptional regulator